MLKWRHYAWATGKPLVDSSLTSSPKKCTATILCNIFLYDYTVNKSNYGGESLGRGNLCKVDGSWGCRSHIVQWWSAASLHYIKNHTFFSCSQWHDFGVCRVYLMKYQGFLHNIRHWKYARISCAFLWLYWHFIDSSCAWWRHEMETFSALLAICAGNSPVPVNFPHNGQWRGALMFSLIYAWINDWVNNREAGDLRRQHGHYDVIVMD